MMETFFSSSLTESRERAKKPKRFRRHSPKLLHCHLPVLFQRNHRDFYGECDKAGRSMDENGEILGASLFLLQRAIFSSIDPECALILINPKGDVLDCTVGACFMLERTLENTIGKPIDQLFWGDDFSDNDTYTVDSPASDTASTFSSNSSLFSPGLIDGFSLTDHSEQQQKQPQLEQNSRSPSQPRSPTQLQSQTSNAIAKHLKEAKKGRHTAMFFLRLPTESSSPLDVIPIRLCTGAVYSLASQISIQSPRLQSPSTELGELIGYTIYMKKLSPTDFLDAKQQQSQQQTPQEAEQQSQQLLLYQKNQNTTESFSTTDESQYSNSPGDEYNYSFSSKTISSSSTPRYDMENNEVETDPSEFVTATVTTSNVEGSENQKDEEFWKTTPTNLLYPTMHPKRPLALFKSDSGVGLSMKSSSSCSAVDEIVTEPPRSSGSPYRRRHSISEESPSPTEVSKSVFMRHRKSLGIFCPTEPLIPMDRAIQVVSDFAIFQIDTSAQIFSWNAGAQRMYGWTAWEALSSGRPISFYDLFASEDMDIGRVDIALEMATKEGRYRGDDLLMRRRGDRKFWGNLCLYSLRDESGLLIGFICAVQDVTESRRLGNQITEQRKALRERDRFLANISHELRTPMNAIVGYSELMLQGNLPTEQRELVRTMLQSGLTLTSILDDIFTWTCIQLHELELQQLDFDLRLLLEDIIDSFSDAATISGVQLVLDMPDEVPRAILGDPVRIRQIILNLISNALKFTKKGFVTLEVACLNTTLCDNAELVELEFNCIDSGIGMTKTEVSRLFQPFQQLDSSSSRTYGGIGLGLAIVKHLVEMMRGTITVESKSNQGSSFKFRVPLIKSCDPMKSGFPVEKDLRGMRILIVDQESNFRCRSILKKQLASFGVGEVLEAYNASGAMRTLRQCAIQNTPIHLALLDDEIGNEASDLAKKIKNHSLPVISKVRCVILKQRPGPLSARVKRRSGSFELYAPLEDSNGLLVDMENVLFRPIRRDSLLQCLTSVSASMAIDQISPRGPQRASREENENISLGNLDLDTKALPQSKKRILLVEDNPVNQMVLIRQLQRLSYEVDIANNGQEALVANSRYQYDTILMDCQMPVLTGWQAVEIIREKESRNSDQRHVLIVAVTASNANREQCFERGFDEVLFKPVTLAQLENVLNRLLHATQ